MRLITLLFVASLMGSCQLPHGDAPIPLDTEILIERTYDAVDNLLAQHRSKQDTDRILVATVVDVNNVRSTSMFGRVVTECIQSRLTQANFDVIHATVREDHMLVRSEGQFLLSRDVSNLAADYNARTALVTTYAVVENSVILSLKLVSTVEGSTLAAEDFVLAKSPSIDEMLVKRGGF
ncbi:MAG: FlgO family outer membrane protein [bacterium]|jgi:TolB-like protein